MSRFTAFLVAAIVSCSAVPALAQDSVELQDGTRIVGTVKTMAGGVLEITGTTVEGGSLKVKMDNIKSIQTSSVHTLFLADGSMRKGTVSGSNGNWTVNNASSGATNLSASDIASVSPPVIPPLRQKGNFVAGARITDGNTRTKSANASAFYEARTETTRLTLDAAWNYAQNKDGVTARNTTGGMKYDYFFDERLFGYVNARLKGDSFADLNLRSTIGAGVGYQFLDRALDNGPADFYEEIGVTYVNDDFDMARDDDYASLRISGRYERDINENMQFFHFHEILPGLEDADDISVDTQTGIRVNLMGNFYANAQVNYFWDNTPAAGTNRTDTEYLFGIGYSFSF
ncbi:MAG: DUF481 domain-containing protein [Planctomycetota bacterium]